MNIKGAYFSNVQLVTVAIVCDVDGGHGVLGAVSHCLYDIC